MEKTMKFVIPNPAGPASSEGVAKGAAGGNYRGEGTYTHLLAFNLARHGHEVLLVSSYWGDYPTPPNLTVSTNYEDVNTDCDAYIMVSLMPEYTAMPNATTTIYGQWGSTLPNYELHEGVKIAYPLKMYYDRCEYENKMYMPIPLAESIKAPNYDKRQTFFANRDSWLDKNPNGHGGPAQLILMEQLKHWHHRVQAFNEIRLNATPEEIARFEALPNKTLIENSEGLTYDGFCEVLSESKLLMASGYTMVSLQIAESVLFGCVPILWERGYSIFDKSEMPLIKGTTSEEFQKLLNDDQFYSAYQNSLSACVTDNLFDNAHDIFMEELK